jgi:hypothetical protein
MIAPGRRLCCPRRGSRDYVVRSHFSECGFHLPITSVLVCCVLSFVASTSMAATPATQEAKQPISTPADTTATPPKSAAATLAPEDSKAVSAPLAAPAVIYVYRQRHISAAGEHPLIIVNFDALAQLHNSNYARRTVPPGLVIVGASPLYIGEGDGVTVPGTPLGARPVISPLPGFGLPQFLRPGPPQSFRECAGLDALRLGEAKQLQLVDVARCIAALEGAEGVVARILSQGDFSGKNADELKRLCDIDPSYGSRAGDAGNPFDRQQVEHCSGEMRRELLALSPLVSSHGVYKGDGESSTLTLDQVRTAIYAGVAIRAEAGKTYYVRYSISLSSIRLELMDEATGAKEMKGMHPAKER